jgi:tetratricopeptide (TPR) repeat protein
VPETEPIINPDPVKFFARRQRNDENIFSMICPYCRNEKMDNPTCPGCGLGEKEALFKAAELYWTEGRQELAVDYYGRYLSLEPGDFDVASKRASYLCSMARERRDPKLFEMADGQIARILEGHWDWQAGHQSRVDLYFCFGKLDSLLAEYERISAQDPSRADLCAEMTRLIRLVMRFKEEKPQVPESLKGEEETSRVLESFWPLLLAIIFSLALSVFFPAGSGPDEESSRKLSLFQQLVIIAALSGSGFYGIWRYQKSREGEKPKKPKGPRPPLEP